MNSNYRPNYYKIEKIYGDYDCSEYNNDLGHYILVLSRIDENGF